MKLIAFDTCLGACSVALVERATIDSDASGRIIAHQCSLMTTGQAEHLFPMLRRVFDDAQVSAADCDGIAVTVGPGTFTGVRLGVAAARGLALAAGLPVFVATSLALVAAAVRAEVGPGPVVAVADARNGELYAQRFDAAGHELTPSKLLPMEAVVEWLTADVWVAGSGARALVSTTGRAIRGSLPEIEPDAAHLATVALHVRSPLLPLYARAPDAKPQEGKSLPRAAS